MHGWVRVHRVTKESDTIEPLSAHTHTHTHTDFFGRNDAKAETPVLWPPHAKS